MPSDYGALGYAGVMTVLTAARAANSVAGDKLVGALSGMKFDLYKGPEYYRVCDHQSVQSVLIIDSRRDVRVPECPMAVALSLHKAHFWPDIV